VTEPLDEKGPQPPLRSSPLRPPGFPRQRRWPLLEHDRYAVGFHSSYGEGDLDLAAPNQAARDGPEVDLVESGELGLRGGSKDGAKGDTRLYC
jgi:hypothetical protein